MGTFRGIFILKKVIIIALLVVVVFYITSLPNLNPTLASVVALGWGYLWGTVTGGPLFAHFFKLGDLRKIGSGNIGTTNVLRTGHKLAAALTLLFDALKVFAPLSSLPYLLGQPAITNTHLFLAAMGTTLGHLFPVWMNFKGGKGIATLAGTTFAFCWPLGLTLIGLWGLVAYVSRYSSLAGITSLLMAIPLAYFFKGVPLMLFYLALAPLILWRHTGNIQRLIQGNETKIGKSCSSSPRLP